MFNKFRAVTMVVSLAQLLMVLVGVLALNSVAQRRILTKDFKKPFLVSFGIIAMSLVIMTLLPTLFFDFQSPKDPMTIERFAQESQDKLFAQQMVNSIVKDRISLMRSDAIRSLLFLLLAAGVIWLWMKEKVKLTMFSSMLLGLIIFDLFGIDKRYLNKEDFISNYAAQSNTTPSPADEQILQDPDPNYKVYDLTAPDGPFNSASASYFHKSLGGYHGAKLRRYQEMYEHQVLRNKPNLEFFNMLNTKYIITADQQGNKIVQTNPQAYGHAWFVNSYHIVPDANAEISALDSLRPRFEAVLDQRFQSQLDGLKLISDTTSKIALTNYKPNELIYKSQSKNEGLAVFSEIYYNVRNEWKVTVDGKPADLLHANYSLRALRLPAGEHIVNFRFEPISVKAGYEIDLVSSILLAVLLMAALFVRSPSS